jgi:hypothetical protein
MTTYHNHPGRHEWGVSATTGSAAPQKPSHPTRTWLSRIPSSAQQVSGHFIGDLIDGRVLDGLSECDADTVDAGSPLTS